MRIGRLVQVISKLSLNTISQTRLDLRSSRSSHLISPIHRQISKGPIALYTYSTMADKQLPQAEYRQLGKSGLRVSVPILGAMSVGDKRWMDWVIEQDEVSQSVPSSTLIVGKPSSVKHCVTFLGSPSFQSGLRPGSKYLGYSQRLQQR